MGAAWVRCGGGARLDVLRQAARGLAALHARRICHRDIKSHNVVIALRSGGSGGGGSGDGSAWVAKIADLGSAAVLDGSGRVTGEVGTSGWSAPEVFSGGPYGAACDVFSCGVMVWEAAGAWGVPDNPLCGVTEEEYVLELAGGARPPVQARNCYGLSADAYGALLRRTWAQDPAARPTAAELERELAELVRGLRGAGRGG
ncbi:kinase-like domain-containing protein [Tribonema minus]|uniref:Kinase-like domain-containing protein n=1 Tax=Tribonema minus TaxID=303371 RepID=A0A835YQX3_9STRA|nr:kinase-like domain-containing protein [Tribonema minus]